MTAQTDYPVMEPASKQDPWPAKPDPYKIGNESEGGLVPGGLPGPPTTDKSGL